MLTNMIAYHLYHSLTYYTIKTKAQRVSIEILLYVKCSNLKVKRSKCRLYSVSAQLY